MKTKPPTRIEKTRNGTYKVLDFMTGTFKTVEEARAARNIITTYVRKARVELQNMKAGVRAGDGRSLVEKWGGFEDGKKISKPKKKS